MSIAHHFFFLNTSAQLCSSTEKQHTTHLGMSPLLFQAVCLYRNQPPVFSLISARPEKILLWEYTVPRHCTHVDQQHLL